MKDNMVISSLDRAIEIERTKEGLIVHTDQSSQYTGAAFLKILKHHKFIRSNSNKENPYDNVLMEAFFRSFKQELLLKRYFKTKKEAKLEIINYVEIHYNKKE